MPQEEQEQIQRLRSDRHGLAVAQQPLVQHVEKVRSELVVVPAPALSGVLSER